MKQWAYKKVRDITEENLNLLGKDGWEICGTSCNEWGLYEILLKKEVV